MTGTVYFIDPTDWSKENACRLRGAGFVVLCAAGFEEADRLLRRRPPDHVVVVDDGREDLRDLLEQIEQAATAPVTLVIDASDEQRYLDGFAAGADDVVPPDCRPDVFVARLRAQLRRSGDLPSEPETPITIGDVCIEPRGRRVRVRGLEVHFTPLEFALLHALMRDPGVVYSREDLLDAVWGARDLAVERTIDAHVWKLRRKIEADSARPEHIFSVPGMGYRFRRPDPAHLTALAV